MIAHFGTRKGRSTPYVVCIDSRQPPIREGRKGPVMGFSSAGGIFGIVGWSLISVKDESSCIVPGNQAFMQVCKPFSRGTLCSWKKDSWDRARKLSGFRLIDDLMAEAADVVGDLHGSRGRTGNVVLHVGQAGETGTWRSRRGRKRLLPDKALGHGIAVVFVAE